MTDKKRRRVLHRHIVALSRPTRLALEELADALSQLEQLSADEDAMKSGSCGATRLGASPNIDGGHGERRSPRDTLREIADGGEELLRLIKLANDLPAALFGWRAGGPPTAWPGFRFPNHREGARGADKTSAPAPRPALVVEELDHFAQILSALGLSASTAAAGKAGIALEGVTDAGLCWAMDFRGGVTIEDPERPVYRAEQERSEAAAAVEERFSHQYSAAAEAYRANYAGSPRDVQDAYWDGFGDAGLALGLRVPRPLMMPSRGGIGEPAEELPIRPDPGSAEVETNAPRASEETD